MAQGEDAAEGGAVMQHNTTQHNTTQRKQALFLLSEPIHWNTTAVGVMNGLSSLGRRQLKTIRASLLVCMISGRQCDAKAFHCF
mmetsp:Transcript_19250/g.44584  ORF Transcript_19250/g.44584 Transcript_19250/m.44584 type:complete len:84 (+) Transcript_19250:580-831(+)